MPIKRSSRVASLLREVLSEIVSSQLKDPSVGRITISRVTISDDLKYARVYFYVQDSDQELESTIEGLQRASGYLRTEAGRRIKMRAIPKLEFIYDDSLDYAERIEHLLKKAGGESKEEGGNG